MINTHNVCGVDIFRLSLQNAGMNDADIYKSLGDVVRRRRKERGLLQEQLAAQIGVSRASLASIETGRQRVFVHQLYALADALDVESIIDLLPGRPAGALRDSRNMAVPISDKPVSRVQAAQIQEFWLSVQSPVGQPAIGDTPADEKSQDQRRHRSRTRTTEKGRRTASPGAGRKGR